MSCSEERARVSQNNGQRTIRHQSAGISVGAPMVVPPRASGGVHTLNQSIRATSKINGLLAAPGSDSQRDTQNKGSAM